MMSSKHRASMDPISRLQQPPRDETPSQRVERLVKEADAQKISDAIDKALEKERKEQFTKLKSRREDLLLLLLGPSGSGKSTFLRQFRLMYDSDALATERDGYRLAIYLSLVHTIRCLLDLLESTQSATQQFTPELSPTPTFRLPSPAPNRKEEGSLKRLRLAPLLGLEEGLRKHIGVVATSGPSANSFNRLVHAPLRERRRSLIRADSTSARSDPSAQSDGSEVVENNAEVEDAVYQVFPSRWHTSNQLNFNTSGNSAGWRSSQSAAPPTTSTSSNNDNSGGKGRKKSNPSSSSNVASSPIDTKNWVAPVGDPSYLFESCLEEINTLWKDCVANGLIAEEGPKRDEVGGARLSDSAKYFMLAIKRVADRKYQPSDDDLMHARVRTVGIEEHFLRVEGQMYHIVDVAGAKGTRPVWASFFEHARAVIFITSLGEFDEPSLHDPDLNSLQDAINTFKDICSNRLLVHVDLILFLNKIDLVKRKINSHRCPPSTIFSDYTAADDYKSFARYARDKFRDVSLQSFKPDRVLYVHLTVATSIEQTRLTIQSVKDTVVRRHLEIAGLT